MMLVPALRLAILVMTCKAEMFPDKANTSDCAKKQQYQQVLQLAEILY